MKLFQILILISILIIIVTTIYCNDIIKNIFKNKLLEKFETVNNDIGLKWLHISNSEPQFGEKISNTKLYDLLNVKITSPVIITKEELEEMNLVQLTKTSYISVGSRFYMPYNHPINDYKIGLKWRILGNKTEEQVEKYYTLIDNSMLREELEQRKTKGPFETIDGEKIIVFTRIEAINLNSGLHKNKTQITYDSYIKVGIDDIIMQPYFEMPEQPPPGTTLNIGSLLSNAFDKSFSRSTSVRTYDLSDEASYNNDNVSNGELSLSSGMFNKNSNSEVNSNITQSDDERYTPYIKQFNNRNNIEGSILDPINNKYLPYTDKEYNNDINSVSDNKINEFVIINIFKSILNRQPNSDELVRNLQFFYEKNINENKLKMQLYNSVEYKMISKMQSNDIEPGLVSFISQDQLIDILKNMYSEDLNKIIPDKMIIPLKQTYIHLQYNDYLFKALIIHDNYSKFENAIMREYIMSDEKLLEVFNEHFILHELRLIANELKRRDLLKRKALQIPISLQTNEDGTSISGSKIDSEETKLDSEKHINDIVKNSDNIFNINIMLNENDLNSSSPYIRTNGDDRKVSSTNRIYHNTRRIINETSQNERRYETSQNERRDENGDLITDEYNEDENITQSSNYRNDGETDYSKKRVYDPITYKQHYRGDPRYRPNVCSGGTKQIVNPIFLNSKTLFNGTDLKEAIENTQVGSIMPKFVYREYENTHENTRIYDTGVSEER
jgi:hypothetical protein